MHYNSNTFKYLKRQSSLSGIATGFENIQSKFDTQNKYHNPEYSQIVPMFKEHEVLDKVFVKWQKNVTVPLLTKHSGTVLRKTMSHSSSQRS